MSREALEALYSVLLGLTTSALVIVLSVLWHTPTVDLLFYYLCTSSILLAIASIKLIEKLFTNEKEET